MLKIILKVQFFRLLFLAVTFLSLERAFSQPLWRQYVPQAFAQLEAEVQDSIRILRQRSDTLRAQMNQIITQQGLDRISIVGEKDIYMKEGMHKHFRNVPEPMQGNFDRNPQIQKLENLHVDLYHADEQLFRWLDFSTILKAHPNRTSFERWTELWTGLPQNQRPAVTNSILSWLADQLACDLVSDIRPSTAKNPFEKIQRFAPESNLPQSFNNVVDDWILPIPSEKILASFPMNGQFAFDNTEPLPETGYVLFPESFNWKMRELISPYNTNFWTRWVSQSGNIKYTLCERRNTGFFFALPDTLYGGKVYKMELIALPNGFSRSGIDDEQCWVEMRETSSRGKIVAQDKLQGEILITTLYFRAGVQDYRTRLNRMHGKIDWEKCTITYKTLDPYDPIEIFGTNTIKPFVTFGMNNVSLFDLQQAINSNEVFYYLTVPFIEETSNTSPDEALMAELDHTSTAAFVRKTSLGDASNYPVIPENRPEDVSIHNHYIAPAYLTSDVPDSIVTSVPIPKITKEHFLQKQKWTSDSVTCTVYLGEMKQFVRVIRLQQTQLKKRIEERASFFYTLDQRAAKREGKIFTLTLDDYRKMEMENLPKKVTTILHAKVPDVLNNKFSLQYNRYFPGTKQMCSSLEVKFY